MFARLGTVLCPVFPLALGIQFLIEPAWFERWATKGVHTDDQAYRFRLGGYRVLGFLCVAIALYMWWSIARNARTA
jgi:hypothetical protein